MTKIIIPARIKSTRLPEKVLKDVKGLPLFVATAKKAIEIIGRESVIVATDSIKVLEISKRYNIHCELTSEKCLTGSDRVVSLSKEKGLISKKQEEKFNKDKNFENVKKSTIYNKVLNILPDAELVECKVNENKDD